MTDGPATAVSRRTAAHFGRWLVPMPLLALGCWPELDARSSSLGEARALAVIASPPEARPGTPVAYELLAASPRGRELAPATLWTTCATPLAAVDTGSVSPDCFTQPGPSLEEQAGSHAQATLPLDGCARFGPDPPPGDARPRDPDASGGFYQPLIVFMADEAVIHLQRLLCNPRSAPADLARDFAAAYVPNRNPSAPVLEQANGVLPAAVSSGASLDLRARWQPSDAEPYAWIDREALELRERREALSVSWFATAGRLESDRSERAEGDPATEASNRWTAPPAPGPVTFWAVLRDSRGGTSFVEASLRVEP